MSRELETKLKAVIESISDGIYMTDGAGICVACNYAFKRITGITGDILGKPVTYLLENKLISENVTMETISSRSHISKVITYPSGCEALVTGNPVLDAQGELLAVVSVVRDLSELNRLKEELRQSKRLASGYLDILNNAGISSGLSRDKPVAREPQMQRVMELARELENTLERLAVLNQSGLIKLEDLPEQTRHSFDTPGPGVPQGRGTVPLKTALAAAERQLLARAMQSKDNLAQIAESLDIDVSTLLRKCKKYGIKRGHKLAKMPE